MRLNWYNLIMIGLALAIIYPDQVLFWINHQTGRAFTSKVIILLEATAIILMAVAINMFMPIYPTKVAWSDMPIYIGVASCVRLFIWICDALFRWFFDL
jgi:hypothetical protein